MTFKTFLKTFSVSRFFRFLKTGDRQRSVLCVYANQTLVLPDAFCQEDLRPYASSNCSLNCPGNEETGNEHQQEAGRENRKGQSETESRDNENWNIKSENKQNKNRKIQYESTKGHYEDGSGHYETGSGHYETGRGHYETGSGQIEVESGQNELETDQTFSGEEENDQEFGSKFYWLKIL